MKTKRFLGGLTLFLFSLTSVFGTTLPLVHAAPSTCLWTGGGADNLFSNTANWTDCAGGAPDPTRGDNLRLTGDGLDGNNIHMNDLTNPTFGNIVLASASFITLAGNDLYINGDITVESSVAQPTISAKIGLVGNTEDLHTFSVPDGRRLEIQGGVFGTGSLVKQLGGSIDFSYGNGPISHAGTVTVAGGLMIVPSTKAIGTGNNGTTVSNGASLWIKGCDQSFSYGENLTLTGSGSTIFNKNYSVPKLLVGCIGEVNNADINYGPGVDSLLNKQMVVNLTGDITLGTDTAIATNYPKITVTGKLSGAHKLSLLDGWPSSLVVDSADNTTGTINSTYNSMPVGIILADAKDSEKISVTGSYTLTLDGSRGATSIAAGGKLKGTGTINGLLSVSKDATVAPGHSPGCLAVSGLSIAGTLEVEIGGTTACTDYDQMKVAGTVNLTGGTLSTLLYGGFVPSVGQSYTIIDNDALDAVTGTFSGLAEGATFTKDGVTYSITYVGGTGNDVVVTVTAVDAKLAAAASSVADLGVPDTGIRLVKAHPLVSLFVTTTSALVIYFISRRYRSALSI